MQLHPPQLSFLFLHCNDALFKMFKIYTLIAKVQCMERDKQNNGWLVLLTRWTR